MGSLSVLSRVRVPAGRYRVGSRVGRHENGERTVTLSNAFEIGTHCITNLQRRNAFREWSNVGETHALISIAKNCRPHVLSIHDGPDKFKLAFGSPKDLASAKLVNDIPCELMQVVPSEDELLEFIPDDRRRDHQPAVSWRIEELVAFANRHGGRLPTEVEWEIAARTADGDARLFDYSTSTGQLLDEDKKLANFGGGAPVDVDDPKFVPNRRGLNHMTGGVWEATGLVLGLYGVGEFAELVDPDSPAWNEFTLRGGSSSMIIDISDPYGLHAAFRHNRFSDRAFSTGARLAWSIYPGQEP